MLIPLLMLGSGFAAIIAVLATTEKNPPVHEPDEAPVPPSPLGVTPPPGATPLGKSGYKLVDQILPALQAASLSSQIPLGVLVGWIARESGGKLSDTTKYDERGYFQLMPDESKALGLDHQRLSTDSTYSINAGLLLIGKYMKQAVALGIAPQGSSFFWKLVKLIHSMGLGAVQKIVAAAKADGSTTSWSALEQFAMDHNSEPEHYLIP